MRYVDPDGRFDWETNTVTSGDKLWKITQEFNEINGTNITYDDIAVANGISDPNYIEIGQKIDFSSFFSNNHVTADVSSPKELQSKAYYRSLFGAGIALVGGGNVEVGYVWDSLGNKGVALSGDLGCGVVAEINLDFLKPLSNLLLNNLISSVQSYTCIDGTIYDFEGSYAMAKVHAIVGLKTDLNNTDATNFSLELSIGGGTFWGKTKVIGF